MVVAYLATRPPLITDDFSAPISRSFPVAVVLESESGVTYGVQKLETIQERNPDRPSLRFLLPQSEIRIDVGDIHRARILEDHGDWQLVEFDYSNTYMATSVYRAYNDRIEPVSYQMTASIGDAIMAVALTIVAVLLYALAVLVNFFRNRNLQTKLADSE